MDQNSNDTGFIGELACLLICTGAIWMMIPGTVTVSEGTLSVTPDYIPLILLVAGAVGMVLLSIMSALSGK